MKVTLTQSETISSLYVDDLLVDEQSIKYTDGLITFIHPLQSSSGYEAKVESGYFNWRNVGIAVIETAAWCMKATRGKICATAKHSWTTSMA